MAPDLPLSVSRAYLVLTGVVWALAWLAAAYAMFTGRPWAPRFARGVGAAFLIWFWVDRLLWVRSEYALRTLPFTLGVTLLACALALLGLRQAAVRRFFGDLKP